MVRPSLGTEVLPIQPRYSFDPLWPDIRSDVFENSFVRNEDGKPVGVVREYLGDNLSEGLRELKFLQMAGVKVAKHLPFVGPDRRRFLLVEYVEGSVMTSEVAAQHTEICLQLAQKVGRYSAAAILAGRSVLTDISSGFQFVLQDNTVPVLIDLDMHRYVGTQEASKQKSIASFIYEEFSDGEGLIPPEALTECERVLAPLHTIFSS